MGQAACNLLGSESQSSDGGTIGRTPCIKKLPNQGEPACNRLSKGMDGARVRLNPRLDKKTEEVEKEAL